MEDWMRPQWRKRNSRKGRVRSKRSGNDSARRVSCCKKKWNKANTHEKDRKYRMRN